MSHKEIDLVGVDFDRKREVLLCETILDALKDQGYDVDSFAWNIIVKFTVKKEELDNEKD